MKCVFRVAIVVATGACLGAGNHIISCKDSPTPGARPAQMACAILARKQIDSLPRNPIVWRYETFNWIAAARRAEGSRSMVVNAGGKIWLL
jgi:hypothetical protein